MLRSKKIVCLPFCALCQGAKAQGLVKRFPATIKPIVEYLIKQEINIIQMSCPELHYQKEDVRREPHGKAFYDNPRFRKICQSCAKSLAATLKKFRKADYQILAILGIEYSPACAVTYQFERGRGTIREKGIFMEEIEKALKREKLTVPLLGINPRGMKKTLNELSTIVEKPKFENLRFLSDKLLK